MERLGAAYHVGLPVTLLSIIDTIASHFWWGRGGCGFCWALVVLCCIWVNWILENERNERISLYEQEINTKTHLGPLGNIELWHQCGWKTVQLCSELKIRFLHMIWWLMWHVASRQIETIEPWLQGPAQGFVKCEPSPEPYKAISRAQLGSAARTWQLGAGPCTSLLPKDLESSWVSSLLIWLWTLSTCEYISWTINTLTIKRLTK